MIRELRVCRVTCDGCGRRVRFYVSRDIAEGGDCPKPRGWTMKLPFHVVRERECGDFASYEKHATHRCPKCSGGE